MQIIEPTRVTVDDTEYEFNHISVKKQLVLAVKLAKVVLEPMTVGLDPKIMEMARSNPDAAKSAIDMSKVIKAFVDNADEKSLEELIDGLLQGTVCIGVGPVANKFEEVFRGRFGHMLKVTYAAAQHYFGDFLAEGLGLLK